MGEEGLGMPDFNSCNPIRSAPPVGNNQYLMFKTYKFYSGIFHELGILKFDDLLHLQAQSFIYRYHNSMLPSSFNGMFIPLGNQKFKIGH